MMATTLKRPAFWLLALALGSFALAATPAQAGAWNRYNRRVRNAERDLIQAERRAELRAVRNTYVAPAVVTRTYVAPTVVTRTYVEQPVVTRTFVDRPVVTRSYVVPGPAVSVPGGALVPADPLLVPTSGVYVGSPRGLNLNW